MIRLWLIDREIRYLLLFIAKKNIIHRDIMIHHVFRYLKHEIPSYNPNDILWKDFEKIYEQNSVNFLFRSITGRDEIKDHKKLINPAGFEKLYYIKMKLPQLIFFIKHKNGFYVYLNAYQHMYTYGSSLSGMVVYSRDIKEMLMCGLDSKIKKKLLKNSSTSINDKIYS